MQQTEAANVAGEARRRIRFGRRVLAALLLAGCLFVGARRIGPVPALGPFFDPANGVWAVARSVGLPESLTVRIPSLEDSVRVVYDSRAVPHIWASNVDDAVRALGYVVARDRLFQLDVQTRATAGRLTEWVGAAALESDRAQRALGLAASAERDFAGLDEESLQMRLLLSYSQGVNSWIDGMRPGDVPFEHKLLGQQPATWLPQYSLYLIKRMGHTLAFSRHDRQRDRIRQMVGEEITDALFPLNSPIKEPMVPNGAGAPRFDFTPLPDPPNIREDSSVVLGRSHQIESPTALPPYGPTAWDGGEGPGSNNWAVSPSRSLSGNAILAGDPHLSLTLPSLWYEAHIVVPGVVDVYGVTIPGVPSIVIGFNRDVAWSFTNAQADVLDYYREVVDNELQPTEYSLDGEWRPIETRTETFYGVDGKVLAVDTLFSTHRGPLLESDRSWLSMRWTVLEPTGAIQSFWNVGLAGSVTEWLDAMEAFRAPPQNGIVADREGNIAIRTIGHFPVRAGDGKGNRLYVGVVSDNDWRGYLPVERYPSSLNPEQGFLASANQQQLDPLEDATYFGVNWIAPWRAMRINSLLRVDSQATAESLQRYHTDPGSVRADLFVPAFLGAAEQALETERRSELSEALNLLAAWDRRYTKYNEGAVLFGAAMGELTRLTWDELELESGRRVGTPSEAVLLQLMHYPESPWWDIVGTSDVIEQRDDVLARSLMTGFERAEATYGPPSAGGWRWESIGSANVRHLLGLPALSALDIPVQGGPGTLNPSVNEGGFGASWRMVVELGPDLEARVTYPGGQSGNPASPWYDDRIEQWADGELESVLFPRTAADIGQERVAGVLTLLPGKDN